MGELKEAKSRWSRKMPKFFRWMMYICGLIAGTALSANTVMNSFGITPHEWWTDICPYLTAGPIGMMFAAKFTCDGGFRDKSMEKLNHNTILDKDCN